ncbi:hypothetical protein ACTRXD_01350 [Nitrospira sp. T9]|uniref:hypothetical protein n=1 Tax=unclassified Nitrospira TaxID=2652172 RepID=UPI003F961AD5
MSRQILLPAIFERRAVVNSVRFHIFKPDDLFGWKFLTGEPMGDFRFLAIGFLAVGRYANINSDHVINNFKMSYLCTIQKKVKNLIC